MRTSDICPTCATYSNALCTLYNGSLLTTLDINPLDSVEASLIKIEAWAASVGALATVVDDPYGVAWNGSTDVPTRNAVYDKIDAIDTQIAAIAPYQTILNQKVTLNASQINALGTTPVTLIAAPGVGSVISVVKIVAKLNWGSVAFDANQAVIEIVGSSASQAVLPSAFVSGTANTFYTSALTSGTDSIVDNAALQISGTDSIAVGDSTIDLYITYEVITL